MANEQYDVSLYQNVPQLVLAFHGCDKEIAQKVLNSSTEHLEPSTNAYDWLGDGIYFWQNDPQRAYEWAKEKQKRDKTIKEPAVIGAVIDLGLCLNLSERRSIELVKKAYQEFVESLKLSGRKIEEYKNSVADEGGFALIRPLDCAVIKHVHEMVKELGITYDTVCGYFQEGKDAFEGAGMKEKSHIQICVRSKECIKGYFLPRVEPK